MPRCKICREPYKYKYSSLTQKTCLKPECLAAWGKQLVAKESKKWVKDKREELKTTKDWLQLLQVVFNTWVRERDKGKSCISSGRPLTGKYDAGHFWSTGAYPNLRFHEDNCHGQTVHDNRDKHGNLNEYRPRLIERIGQERFDAMEAMKNRPLKLTLPEIKDLIKHYRAETKILKGE